MRLTLIAALITATAACGEGAAGDDPRAAPLLDPATVLPDRPALRTCAARWVAGAPPALLSESGCFTRAGGALLPSTELIPYDVNAPLWTEGAHKARYFAIPAGATIQATPDGDWTFPSGTVFVKTFSFALRDPAGHLTLRPVETRLMVRTEAAWDLHAYVWSPEGDDATLTRDGAVLQLDVGPSGSQAYGVPSDAQCRYCHVETAAMILGPRSAQLDRIVDVPGGQADQLAVFAAEGLFDRAEPPRAAHPLVDPLGDAPLEDRARSWLAAQCGHCHRPGGWRPPDLTMDLRFDTSLADAHICGTRLQYTDLFAGGDYRIVPGDPDASNLYRRLVQRGRGHMPPLASEVYDDLGIAVVRAWIASLEGCPD